MLKLIEFENFKRFRRFSLSLRSGNILVGPNNSGKSSILDAMRVLDACLRYSKTSKPKLIGNEKGVFDGFEIPESYLPFDLANITNNYNSEDAKLTFHHENGSTAHIWLHPTRTVRFFIDSKGKRFSTSKKFRDSFPLEFIIVPPLSPLEAEEPLVVDATVQRNRATRLAARSFRNIWYRQPPEEFEKLKERVERAWPNVTLHPPELLKSHPPRLEMFFQENRMTREVQWAGFGFQVWLQIHTHLLRGSPHAILVLDEPDIYLHPDLQHRLYHDVKEIFPQYFLATHATEIINEADSNEVVVIDPKGRSGKRIRTDNDYDAMLSYIGSAENADFAKISKVKKVVFVEGNDVRLLRRFAATLKLERLSSDQKAPIFRLGGFSQWKRAQHTVWAFKQLLGIEIKVSCIFDRDYRSSAETEQFVAEMNASGVDCYVLERKEIENYLLVPEAISRAANAKLKSKSSESKLITPDAVQLLLDKHCEGFATDSSAQISTHVLRFDQSQGSHHSPSTIISKALKDFETTWKTAEGRARICPGKDVLRETLKSISENYGVSLSVYSIANQLKVDEIDSELSDMLFAINKFLEN